jgi:ABC-2 type transport system ATP-binding protein
MTCDRIAIINKGRVVATNTPENLMAQLTGGSGYELEVEGEAADIQSRLIVFLQGLPNVKLVEQLSADLPEHHKLRVIAEPGTELVGRDIAKTVVGAGVGLYEMRRSQATLEDVFLELTTEEKPLDASTDLQSEGEETEPSAGEAA